MRARPAIAIALPALLLGLFAPAPAHAAKVLDVRVGEHADFSRLVFELDARAGYRVDRCAAERLVVSIAAHAPAGEVPVRSGRIRGVEIEPGAGGLRAHVELQDATLRSREMILSHPNRIVIDVLHTEGRAPSVSPGAAGCVPDTALSEPAVETPEEAMALLRNERASAPTQAAVWPIEPAEREPHEREGEDPALASGARADPSDDWEDAPERWGDDVLLAEDADAPAAPQVVRAPDDPHGRSRISNAPAPLRTDEVPDRPLTLTLGNPFLGRGVVWKGFELPTGAVWQPSLLVFGTSRLAVQGEQTHETRAEAVARLDLFANLQLSGTERVLVGIRPLDRDGKFTGYRFLPDSERDRETELNARIRTLFFEGDLGEMFPFLDPGDSRMLDLGVAVGRQAMRLQEGLLLDDSFDSIGLVRNNLLPRGTSNLRMTALYGWDQLHRGDNQRDRFSKLYALLSSADLPWNTLDLDLLFVESQAARGGDGLYGGLSSVQRIRGINTALRATGSLPLDGSSDAVDQGLLFFGELSWTPPLVHDLLYLNAFFGLGDFTSAARGPDAGGPLARTGILYEAYGLGSLGAPLGNDARRSSGGALGYQMFLSGRRRQLVLELGGRHDARGEDRWSIGAAARFQQAIGQRHVLQLDLAVSESPDTPVTPLARVEWRMKF